MTNLTPDSGHAPGMSTDQTTQNVADHYKSPTQKFRRHPIHAACDLRDMLAPSKVVDQQTAHEAACHLVGELVSALGSGPLPKLGPAQVDRGALSDAVNDAYRLSFLAGGLDTLHQVLPSSVHPEAGEHQRRAADALDELIQVVIQRADALAARLDRLSTAAR